MKKLFLLLLLVGCSTLSTRQDILDAQYLGMNPCPLINPHAVKISANISYPLTGVEIVYHCAMPLTFANQSTLVNFTISIPQQFAK